MSKIVREGNWVSYSDLKFQFLNIIILTFFKIIMAMILILSQFVTMLKMLKKLGK